MIEIDQGPMLFYILHGISNAVQWANHLGRSKLFQAGNA